LGHMDPSDNQDSGAAKTADAEPLSRAKSAGSAPGSLMSLKIRKRASVSREQPPPLAPRDEARAPDPVTVSSSEKTGKTRPTSDAISRVTRRAQSTQAPRAPAPRQAPAHRPSAVWAPSDPAPAPSVSPAPARNNDIVAYWTRLRASRRFPRSSEIDAATIAESWPNSILMRCRPGSRALEPDKVFMSGEAVSPGLTGLRGRGRSNLSPMMLQWLLALAGAVVRESRPMNDVETFPSVKRVVHYRAVALPFSDNEDVVDHVLCHFQPEA
jgi:hypothetical protein